MIYVTRRKDKRWNENFPSLSLDYLLSSSSLACIYLNAKKIYEKSFIAFDDKQTRSFCKDMSIQVQTHNIMCNHKTSNTKTKEMNFSVKFVG